MSLPKVPALNDEWVVQILTHFIKEELHKFGIQKAVLGLSAVEHRPWWLLYVPGRWGRHKFWRLKCLIKTVPKKVWSMPDLLVKQLKIRALEISITEQVEAYFAKRPELSALQKGNKMARERMSILYDFSVPESALVIGTSNKTELLLG